MNVSVVIPTFNRAPLLKQAVASVLAQTVPPLELIVVDDGSTDDSAEVIREFDDAPIRYIWQSRRGVSAALNTGLRTARGELIGRVDSDDLWMPQLLGELVPHLERDPQLALAYARAQWMDAQGTPLPQRMGAPEKFPGHTLKSLLYGDFVTPMAVILRKSAVEAVGGYDETLRANEDWDLWIRLAEKYRFAYVNQVLAYYRVHPENLTRAGSKDNRRVLDDRLQVLGRYYARAAIPREALEIKPLATRNLYQDLALRHLNAGRRQEALRWYARSVSVAPNPISAIARAVRELVYQRGLARRAWGVNLGEKWVARQNRKS